MEELELQKNSDNGKDNSEVISPGFTVGWYKDDDGTWYYLNANGSIKFKWSMG